MHRTLLLALCCLLLAVAPVQAQPSTPQPTNVVRDLSEAAQTFGVLNVVLVIAVLILGAIVVLLVIVAYKGLTPLLNTIHSLNEAREDLQGQLFKRLERGDTERAKTAELNERTATILTGMETKTEAQQARTDAVSAVNTHTTTEHDETRREIKAVSDKLDEVMNILRKRIGDEPLVEELADVKQRVVKLVDTAPLDPNKVPNTDPAAGTDVWNSSDTPDISHRPEGKSEGEP